MTKAPVAGPGIDLGKNSCSLASMDVSGAVLMRKRMPRDAIVTFAATTRLRHCDGGVPRRPLSWAFPRGAWPYDQADVTGIVQPHVKAQKNDDRDGCDLADDTLYRADERRPARSANSRRPREPGRPPHKRQMPSEC